MVGFCGFMGYFYNLKKLPFVYQFFIKPILFLFPPEKAHRLTLFFLKIALALPLVRHFFKSLYSINDERLKRKVFGLTFENPVGLAAGFDKDGKHFKAMTALGFGFIEIGTVTPKPQSGNPKPRLFRLPKDGALINRMGFNNEGVEALVERLKKGRPQRVILGANIGKNKDTPNDRASEDYAICFEALFPYVDYFVVNVSSPNTPNLRDLQEKEPLTRLLSHLQKLNRPKKQPKPILLKIAPDLNNEQLVDILEIVASTQIAGIIATNTSIARDNLTTNQKKIKNIGAGGLSGTPLSRRSTEVIRFLNTASAGKVTVIGVGGIGSTADAMEKLKAGASLIQIYTGLIYEGPSLVKAINRTLLEQI